MNTSTALVPHGTLDLVTRAFTGAATGIQPVSDVADYLERRKPVANPEEEESLFITLPDKIRSEVTALIKAYGLVNALARGHHSVQSACKKVLAMFTSWDWQLKRFRARYDAWVKSRDWVVLVNRAKAPVGWRAATDGLPDAFLDYVAARMGRYKRWDARREAIRSVRREYLTGRTESGAPASIPGYQASPGPHHSCPTGWSYSNIMRQIKARNVLPDAAAALMLQGTAAAKEHVPPVRGTREGLRFMEEVQFDDVKTDWRIWNPQTRQHEDLWLLIARDRATTVLLGFGMRPARMREDGTQEHLKLRDMKQLCGWLLERFGLPPYPMKWKIERGTATLSEGSAAALQELLPSFSHGAQAGKPRIEVSYSSMIGGTSPAGYFERRIGNSKGKASLESHNRGMHIIGAHLPAQTGPHYAARPADLAAREKECKEIAYLSDFLPEHQRDELGYGVLTVHQARTALRRIFDIQNRRDDHTLEGFEEILEWQVLPHGQSEESPWQPVTTAPAGDVKWRKRMEMPLERAARLVAESGTEGWTKVSPAIITAFYEHTQRPVKISTAGEIVFRVENRDVIFMLPPGAARPEGRALPSKLLGYSHPDDLRFLVRDGWRGGHRGCVGASGPGEGSGCDYGGDPVAGRRAEGGARARRGIDGW